MVKLNVLSPNAQPPPQIPTSNNVPRFCDSEKQELNGLHHPFAEAGVPPGTTDYRPLDLLDLGLSNHSSADHVESGDDLHCSRKNGANLPVFNLIEHY